ncbi:hypothetical protein [Bradyrhizobium sp. B117]|uniref:hypothetical protein n=1 Tax=Bradyrhizobium sp. B117 TaxID=3140246 RepID=UPI003183550D
MHVTLDQVIGRHKPLLHTMRDVDVVPGRALRASCGRALQIFPGAMTDNILVIDGRERFCAREFAGVSAKQKVFT